MLLFSFFQTNATEYSPWFGNLFELEFRPSYLYQHYTKINTGNDSFSHQSDNHFLNLSLAVSPWPDWNGEIELTFADTSETNFNFEKGKLTARYLFLDDLLGDPLSLAMGGSLSFLNKNFLDDFVVPEHGDINAELFLSLGKEIPECFIDTWAYRYWALLALGQANRGVPWLRAHAEWDINYCDCHEFGFFSEFLMGFGNNNIDPLYFEGYSLIRHRSLDIGAFYRKAIPYLGSLTIDYAYRPYAHNFPENAHSIKVTLLFTFNPDYILSFFL